MLGDYPVDVVLLAPADSHLVISGSTVGTTAGQTQAVFRVKTVDGIADMGFAQ